MVPTNPNNSLESSGSGVIEIVMDEDDKKNVPQQGTPAAPEAFAEDPQSRSGSVTYGHSRGRSVTDNSITGRISRVTDRMRSASRGRNTASPNMNRTQPPQPPPMQHSPYESVVPPGWTFEQALQARSSANPTPANGQPANNGPQQERHPLEVRAAMMEGGMI